VLTPLVEIAWLPISSLSQRRSRGGSWAPADTFVLSFLVTGKVTAAVGIVGFELFTKSVLYYGHERAWEISWLTCRAPGSELVRKITALKGNLEHCAANDSQGSIY
jgi:hypothetical protein